MPMKWADDTAQSASVERSECSWVMRPDSDSLPVPMKTDLR